MYPLILDALLPLLQTLFLSMTTYTKDVVIQPIILCFLMPSPPINMQLRTWDQFYCPTSNVCSIQQWVMYAILWSHIDLGNHQSSITTQSGSQFWWPTNIPMNPTCSLYMMCQDSCNIGFRVRVFIVTWNFFAYVTLCILCYLQFPPPGYTPSSSKRSAFVCLAPGHERNIVMARHPLFRFTWA